MCNIENFYWRKRTNKFIYFWNLGQKQNAHMRGNEIDKYNDFI